MTASFTGRRRTLALLAALWLPLAVLVVALLALAGGLGWVEALALGGPLLVVFAPMALSARYVCRAAPLGGAGGAARAVAVVMVAAGLSAGVWVAAAFAWARLLAAAPASVALPSLGGRLATAAPLLFGVGVLLYLLSAAGHYLAQSLAASQRAERRALELRVLAREAELRALRAQVDPHFLFNSLNAVASLAGHDAAGARKMALMLAELLRRGLRLAERETIPLADELALARAYLAVEQVRFGDRLTLEEAVDETAAAVPVPARILQPLVENAVKHGVAARLEGGTVRIEVDRRGGELRVAVENDRDPDSDLAAAGLAPRSAPGRGAARDTDPPRAVAARRGDGVGLANVRRRLDAHYGRAARLELAAGPDRFRAELWLPAPSPAAAGSNGA